MSALDNIVSVTITKDTATVSRVGFGIPAILTYHTKFAEVYRTYGSLTEMTDDGFTASDREYELAAALFAQNPRPTSVVVGRRANAPTRDVKLTPKTPLLPSTAYDIVVNGETMAYTTDATPTVAEVTAGIETAVNGGAQNVLATDNTTDVDVENAATPGGAPSTGIPFGLTFDASKWTLKDNSVDPTPGLDDDLTDLLTANSDWYGLVTDAYGASEIVAAATIIEATPNKIYGAESQDSEVVDAGTGIGATLKASALERTFLSYHPKASDQYPGAGWLGKQLPTDPGSTTWKFKTLSGVEVYSLTSAQQAFADGENVNHYQEVAGINITAEGKMAGGEFIDVTRFIDWLAARIQEDVFRTMAVNPKIPFTDLGIQTIVNEVEGVLKEGIARGGLAADPAPFVTAPRAADVSSADKATRTLPDIEFQATLAGAVHKVIIAGRVVV